MDTTPMVAVEVKERTREYMYRLVELGVVVGPVGAMEVPPDLQRILDAVHHVIAGGKTEIVVREPGDPTVLDELKKRFDTVIQGGWK